MAEIRADLEHGGENGWVPLDGGTECWFGASSHAAGAELIAGLAALVPSGPAPEFDLRQTGVEVRIPPDLAALDQTLPRTISDLARSSGLRPEPAAVQRIGIGIESPEPAAVIDYWRIVCGYERFGDDLVDGLHRDPTLRFTTSDQARPLRNRIHLDVDAGQPFTPSRLAELERAGGHIVRDSISADADGNEACIPFRAPGSLDDSAALADWRQLMGAMVRYSTPSFVRAAELATATAKLADEAGRPLIIDVRQGTVIIDSGKDQQEDETFGLDAKFRELAQSIQSAARALGLIADPDSGLRHLQVAIDAADIPVVQGFWLAALGYQTDPRTFVTDLVDPVRRGPVMWFQQLEHPDDARQAQRNRIRLRLALPRAEAPIRLSAALETGGTIVDDSAAPDRWLVGDPEGNELELVAQ